MSVTLNYNYQPIASAVGTGRGTGGILITVTHTLYAKVVSQDILSNSSVIQLKETYVSSVNDVYNRTQYVDFLRVDGTDIWNEYVVEGSFGKTEKTVVTTIGNTLERTATVHHAPDGDGSFIFTWLGASFGTNFNINDIAICPRINRGQTITSEKTEAKLGETIAYTLTNYSGNDYYISYSIGGVTLLTQTKETAFNTGAYGSTIAPLVVNGENVLVATVRDAVLGTESSWSIPLIYELPTIEFSAYRVNDMESTTLAQTGEYGYCTANITVFELATASTIEWVNGTNSGVIQNPTTDAPNNWHIDGIYVTGQYNIQVRIYDNWGMYAETEYLIPSATIPVSFYDNGHGSVGISFGRSAITGGIDANPDLDLTDDAVEVWSKHFQLKGGLDQAEHNQLVNRDAADAHPMSAITGLQSALNSKLTTTDIIILFGGNASNLFD